MKKERKLPLRIAAAIFGLLALYVAGSGPLYRFAATTDTNGGTFWKCTDAAFQPLLGGAAATGYDQPILKYLRWWGLHTRQSVLDLSPQKRVVRIGVLPPVSGVPDKRPPSTPASTPEAQPPAALPQ